MSDYAVVITARMASERLPGKALSVYSPNGTPNLIQIVKRWQASDRDPAIIVATTDGPEDGAIADLCVGYGVPCYRGSRDDVVGRMDSALKAFAPDARWIARGSADNPLVDVGLADWRMDILTDTNAEGLVYADDMLRLTYCATTDVWSRSGWDKIAEGSSGSQREHPGTFYFEMLHRFQWVAIQFPRREYVTPHRTELDTAQDLEMFRGLWQAWVNNGSGEFTEQRIAGMGGSGEFTKQRMTRMGGSEQRIAGMGGSARLARINGAEGVLPTLWALCYLDEHPELAALNASVELKTHTKVRWKKGRPVLCQTCQAQVGANVAGNFEVGCPRCGKPLKWYSQGKPKPSMMTY